MFEVATFIFLDQINLGDRILLKSDVSLCCWWLTHSANASHLFTSIAGRISNRKSEFL